MFNLTRKTDYALVALAALARQEDGDGQTTSARQIAEDYNLPLPVLTKVLKELHRGGLIDSRRGSQGGYRLARPARRITLGEVVEAIEGPASLTLCCEQGEPAGRSADADQVACSLVACCPITRTVRQVNRRIHDVLMKMTLAELMAERIEELFAPGRPARRLDTGVATE